VDAATKATSAIFTYTAGASKYLIVKVNLFFPFFVTLLTSENVQAYRASIGNVYDPYSRDSENAKAIAKHISGVFLMCLYSVTAYVLFMFLQSWRLQFRGWACCGSRFFGASCPFQVLAGSISALTPWRLTFLFRPQQPSRGGHICCQYAL
jgi:hypothetical protein